MTDNEKKHQLIETDPKLTSMKKLIDKDVKLL